MGREDCTRAIALYLYSQIFPFPLLSSPFARSCFPAFAHFPLSSSGALFHSLTDSFSRAPSRYHSLIRSLPRSLIHSCPFLIPYAFTHPSTRLPPFPPQPWPLRALTHPIFGHLSTHSPIHSRMPSVRLAHSFLFTHLRTLAFICLATWFPWPL